MTLLWPASALLYLLKGSASWARGCRLRRVLAIVQAHADDLLGIRDAGAELDGVLGEHEARATGRALDEPGERLELAAALQQPRRWSSAPAA